ncbi:MAG: type I CRISPR-associated protein Cas7 [Verrucomicrobiota bacterium]
MDDFCLDGDQQDALEETLTDLKYEDLKPKDVSEALLKRFGKVIRPQRELLRAIETLIADGETPPPLKESAEAVLEHEAFKTEDALRDRTRGLEQLLKAAASTAKPKRRSGADQPPEPASSQQTHTEEPDEKKEKKPRDLLASLIKAQPQAKKLPAKEVGRLLERFFDRFSLKLRIDEACKGQILEERLVRHLCENFVDIRYFGAVVSTEGPLNGSFYGQIRGPLQFTFAETFDRIHVLDIPITRCAEASQPTKPPPEAEDTSQQPSPSGQASDKRTMGRKYPVAYGIYHCRIHLSPAFAAKAGFTYYDLDNFLFAVTRMLGDYNTDNSANRTGMQVLGLVDFQHTSSLGNAPAHALFDLVKVEGIKFSEEDEKNRLGKNRMFKSSGSEFPQGLHDYSGSAPDGPIYTDTNAYGIVTGCTDREPPPKDGNRAVSNITARRLVWKWKIPEKTENPKAS